MHYIYINNDFFNLVNLSDQTIQPTLTSSKPSPSLQPTSLPSSPLQTPEIQSLASNNLDIPPMKEYKKPVNNHGKRRQINQNPRITKRKTRSEAATESSINIIDDE